MKKLLLAAIVTTLWATVGHAADITWADKATGGTFTAADANEVKSAVNSKANSADLPGLFEPIKGADDNYVTNAEKTIIGNTSGSNSGDQAASGVAFTPNGSIAAADVQSAIEEVRDEAGAGEMIYPGAGIPASTGSAWGTSYTLDTDIITGVSASDDTIPSAKSVDARFDALPELTIETIPTTGGTGKVPASSWAVALDADGDGSITDETWWLALKHSEKFVVKAPVDADDFLIGPFEQAITVTHLKLVAAGGGSIAVTLQTCAADGTTCSDLDGAITADGGTDTIAISNSHIRELGSTAYNTLPRATQSPDGTKVVWHGDFMKDAANKFDLFYVVAYNPHPPEIVSVTNGTVRFDWGTDRTVSRGYTQRGWPDEATDDPPPPRETKQFRLWKSADGTTGWEPVAVLNANIFGRYDFSTGTWLTNKYWEITDPDPSGYYAVTAVEWSGLESKTLSNVFSSAGVQTATYPPNPKSGNGVTSVFNNALTRYYNIYAKDGTNPTIVQNDRVASIPVASGTSYVDWLGNIEGTTKYIVTAVDSQGNESAALERTVDYKKYPATADGQYTIAWTGEGVPQVPVDPEEPIEPEPTCFDGVLNGTETGVDCGGSCPPCEAPAVEAHWRSRNSFFGSTPVSFPE